jgi:23S rRNA pseudouridine1911/1915/1917 synthase
MYNILFEDDCLLVVDKPAGLVVIPAANEKKLSLVELLNKKALEQDAAYRLHPCHRIDKDSSGIVIFAKGKKNQSIIMEQFRKGQVKKKYIVFVRGNLHNKEGTLVDYIKPFGKHTTRKAMLRYWVLQEQQSWSVVEVELQTGRTHQVRIQFAQIKHPLLGERLYAFGRDFKTKFRRLALHAGEVSFYHPVQRKIIHLHAPLPADMKKFLELRQ